MNSPVIVLISSPFLFLFICFSLVAIYTSNSSSTSSQNSIGHNARYQTDMTIINNKENFQPNLPLSPPPTSSTPYPPPVSTLSLQPPQKWTIKPKKKVINGFKLPVMNCSQQRYFVRISLIFFTLFLSLPICLSFPLSAYLALPISTSYLCFSLTFLLRFFYHFVCLFVCYFCVNGTAYSVI